MNNNSIDNSLYLTNTPQRTPSGSSLGKDDFMKILIAQLQNQDPLNPMEDREFIAQMASFSSLEQVMNMTEMFETFIMNQTNSAIVQNSQMIGKQIKYMENLELESGDVEEITRTGIVKAVSFKNGDMLFELDNGEKVKPEFIFEIRDNDDASSEK